MRACVKAAAYAELSFNPLGILVALTAVVHPGEYSFSQIANFGLVLSGLRIPK